jgi:hypothetical protein
LGKGGVRLSGVRPVSHGCHVVLLEGEPPIRAHTVRTPVGIDAPVVIRLGLGRLADHLAIPGEDTGVGLAGSALGAEGEPAWREPAATFGVIPVKKPLAAPVVLPLTSPM